MAPRWVSDQQLQGGNTNFPLIGSPGGQRVGWWVSGQMVTHPKALGWAGNEAPVLTGATRGNPSILHACNIQLSSRLVRSTASVGISVDPPQDQVPRRGGLDGRGSDAGLRPAP